jgi:5-methylthioadenosine/S-adenosylhomocysteine deaminase
MTSTIIKNGIFVTMNELKPIVHGYMTFEGNTITAISEELPAPLETFDEVIDGKHRLYMPGLVNTHGHAAMSLLRGYGDDLALQVWLQEKMWPIEGKYTAHDVRYGTLLSIVEMLKGGTTSFVDMYDQMNEVALAVEQAGIRACLTRGVIGFCSPAEQTTKLEEAKQFVRDWHGKVDGRITTMISPHAPYTCAPDYISRFIEASHELNVPLHTHMSETAREVAENVEQYGQRPVAHLEQLGFFSRPSILAHAVHLTDEEIAVLARYDVRVSHNPGSNLKLASGIARLVDLHKAGVLVSLGTDSAASNNNLDMFEEIRLAALLHKGISGDPTAIPAATALKMGTIDGANSIWLNKVGSLQTGYKADFIAVDIDQAHFLPRSNFISHLVYSASAKDVTDVWVDGKCLVRAGQCVTLDEEKIKREFELCYERLTAN